MDAEIRLKGPVASLFSYVEKNGPVLVPKENKLVKEILGLVLIRETSNEKVIEIGFEDQFKLKDEQALIESEMATMKAEEGKVAHFLL